MTVILLAVLAFWLLYSLAAARARRIDTSRGEERARLCDELGISDPGVRR